MRELTRDLHERAVYHGLHITTRLTETTLVRRIQQKEGHIPCFRTDLRECCKGRCEWTDECKNCLIASWMR